MTPRLFLQVASLEARTRLSYRVDFWINAVVGFAVELLVAWFLWDAIFSASGAETIGGRTFHGMIAYMLSVLLLGRFVRGRDFDGTVSSDIYEGGLNRYLVFPTGYRIFKYAQTLGRMAPVIFQVLILGAIVVPLLGIGGEIRITAGAVVMTVIAVMAANLLNFLMIFPLQATAFWADNVWSLMVAQRMIGQIIGGFMLPLAVFPGWARTVLEYLPWRFFFDFPARVLLGEIGPAEWARGMLLVAGWCFLFGMIGRAVWRRGLFQYSGVGI